MAKAEIPGSRRLSARAKEMWDDVTKPENVQNSRQVVFNLVHNYCFFLCQQPSCDGCNVVKLRSWVSNMKEVPQNIGVPVIRELDVKALEKAEDKVPSVEVKSADVPENPSGKAD